MLLKHERELCYVKAYSVFYRPSEKELEVTDDDLKPYAEIKEYTMGLDKAIEHGKEHRKQYRGSKVFDRTCRNHGGCPCCKDNRLIHTNRLIEKSNQELRNFNKLGDLN